MEITRVALGGGNPAESYFLAPRPGPTVIKPRNMQVALSVITLELAAVQVPCPFPLPFTSQVHVAKDKHIYTMPTQQVGLYLE